MEEPVNTEVKEIPGALRDFFNPDAKISRLPEGKYKVETILVTGIAEGGQKVELTVEEETPIEDFKGKYKKPKEEGEWRIENGWNVEKMLVNGKDFLLPGQRLYLVNTPKQEEAFSPPIVKREKKFPSPTYADVPPFDPFGFDVEDDDRPSSLPPFIMPQVPEEIIPPQLIGLHMAVFGKTKDFQLALTDRLKAGDHLAFLLHEYGHLKKDAEGAKTDVLRNFALIYEERMRKNKGIRLSGAFQKKPADEEPKWQSPSFREMQYYLSLLYEERRATRNALFDIKQRRENGVDLFPDDPNLVKVKESLKMALMTYIEGDSELQEMIEDKADTFLNFD